MMGEKTPFTRNIFLTAEDFSSAAFFLSRCIAKTNEFDLSLPSILNDVISVEIYLKCLYALENINSIDIDQILKTFRRCGHDIKKIFNKITPENQSKIEDIYNEYIKCERMLNQKAEIEKFLGKAYEYDFNTSLDENTQAFESFRYAFEKNTWGSVTGTEALKFAILSSVKELKPEWFIEKKEQDLSAVSVSDTNERRERSFSSKEIFQHADRFAKAVYFLSEQREIKDKKGFPISIFVNMAFTLELYFKCLYHLESNDIITTHNIEKIFNKLTPDSQLDIRNKHKEFIESDDFELRVKADIEKITGKVYDNSIDAALNDFSDAFVTFRYAYERKFGSARGGMALKLAVLSRIKKLQPEWRK